MRWTWPHLGHNDCPSRFGFEYAEGRRSTESAGVMRSAAISIPTAPTKFLNVYACSADSAGGVGAGRAQVRTQKSDCFAFGVGLLEFGLRGIPNLAHGLLRHGGDGLGVVLLRNDWIGMRENLLPGLGVRPKFIERGCQTTPESVSAAPCDVPLCRIWRYHATSRVVQVERLFESSSARLMMWACSAMLIFVFAA
jgi:hypothetical protein